MNLKILKSSTGLMIKYMNLYDPDSEELKNFIFDECDRASKLKSDLRD